MTPQVWPEKDPQEVVFCTFEFLPEMAGDEQISGAPVIDATLISGTDPEPGALLSGSPLLVGSAVRQTLAGGVSGCTYKLSCRVGLDSGRVLVLAATLPVRAA